MTYLLVINGKPEGPFNLEELKARKIHPTDFIRTAEMHDYKEAQEMPELRALFGFEKPPLLVQYYGSFDQRLLATAIDWLIILAAVLTFAIIASVLITNKDQRMEVLIGILLLAPLARLIYNIMLESSKKQATIGKQLLKITVCDLYGDQLSISRAALRNMAKIISVVPFFAGYFLAFFSKKSQALHDEIAGTMVIKDRLI